MNLCQQSFLDKYEKELDEIIELQDMIIQCNDIDHLISVSQIPPKFLSSKFEFSKLITTIQIALFARHTFYDSYEKLIVELLPYIKRFFNSDEIYYFSILNQIKLFFYRNGLISIDTIIEKAQIHKSVSYLFSYEIYQERINDFNNFFKSKESFLSEVGFSDFESFLEFREKWTNNNPVTVLIREDDADKLQEYIAKTNLDYDHEIPYSLFEDLSCFFKKKDMPKMIDYAAFYGSINVFKYLMMNNSKVTEKTMEYAVYGGSYEIIHILENLNCPTSNALEASIRIHNNELYDYFINTVGLQHTDKTMIRAVVNYNIKVIKEILSNNEYYTLFPKISDDSGTSLLGISISQVFPDLTEMFSTIKGFNLNEQQNSFYTYLMEACFSRSLEIAKFLVEKVKVDVNATTLLGIFIFYYLILLYLQLLKVTR